MVIVEVINHSESSGFALASGCEAHLANAACSGNLVPALGIRSEQENQFLPLFRSEQLVRSPCEGSEFDDRE